MTIYTDPFGGNVVEPSDVNYSALSLTTDTTLAWPADSISVGTAILTRIIDVTPDAAARVVIFPDARRVSVGYDTILRNLGADDFTIEDAGGNVIATVATGTVRYLYLIDNSTENGTWRSLVFGTGVSSVDAASLVGLGLTVIGATLNAAQDTNTFAADQSITDQDRSVIWVWNGGAGTLSLPATSAVDNSFFFGVINRGTGVLTVDADGADTIDGGVSITLQPSESAIIACGPTTEWFSLGRGRSTQFDFTILSKAITGGTVTLTPNEASNVVHKYTGILLSNCEVVLPSVVQVYYMSNQTTGAFSVTFKTAGVGTTIIIPQGQNAVLLCDGTNIINASTTAVGVNTLQLLAGTVAAPSLQWPDTSGMYQPASSAIGVSIAGVEVARFNATGVVSSIAPAGSTNLTNKLYVDGAVKMTYLGKSANYTILAADVTKLIDATANTFTFSFDPVATLGANWWCIIRNSGTGDVTLDPDGAELIDGLASYIMYPGESRLVQCDGATLRTVVLNPFQRRFDANGTFTKPPGYRLFSGMLWGGGGAGGRFSTGTGGGGGGGSCVPFDFPAANFAATETVTIAAIAAGSGVNAAAGTAGNNSTLGTLITAYGGGAGGGVTAANGAGGGGAGGLSAGVSASGSSLGAGGDPGGAAATGNDGWGGMDGTVNAARYTAWGGAGGGRGTNAGAGIGGANSMWGGSGGGGSSATSVGAQSTSRFGGAGGIGGIAAGNGSDGTRPGGGGGGACSGTSGSGAGGRLEIWGSA